MKKQRFLAVVAIAAVAELICADIADAASAMAVGRCGLGWATWGGPSRYDKSIARRRAVQECQQSTLRRWGRRDFDCGVVTTVVDDCTAVARDRCTSWSPTPWGQDHDWSPGVAADRARRNCWWYGGHECHVRYVCPYYYTSSGPYNFTSPPTQPQPHPPAPRHKNSPDS